ncbi:hypothetical protein FKP32DRAFT_579392 [Trametes sanguinea]|nr:hypothetical protein FKP32DRAFT_579392 [Trametes sanguinea]
MMNQEALRKLPRVQLQKLAKTHGVKANAKSEQIIHQLVELYPGGVPSNVLEEQPSESVLPNGSPNAGEPQAPKLPATPPTRPKKRATPKRRPQRKIRSQLVEPEDEALTQAVVNGPEIENRASTSTVAATPPESVQQAAQLPPARCMSAAQKTGEPSGATRAASTLPPLSALRGVAGLRAQFSRESISELGDDHTGDTGTWVPQLPEGPLFSISTGPPPAETRQEIPQNFAQAIRDIMEHGPFPPINREEPSSDDVRQHSPEPPTEDDTGSRIYPVFSPAEEPANGDDGWTPSTPNYSWAQVWAAGKAARERQAASQPRANEKQLKDIVCKIADISRVQQERLAEVDANGERALKVQTRMDALRTAVRQEEAQCERMINYLAYWNPEQKEWTDDQIWDRALPTRIDEEGNEVEIVSDDEEAMAMEEQRPSGARPTEIVMRRFVGHHDEENEYVARAFVQPSAHLTSYPGCSYLRNPPSHRLA